MKLGLALASFFISVACAAPVPSIPADTNLSLSINGGPGITHIVTWLDADKQTKGGLIRGAFTISSYEKPTLVHNKQLVAKIMKTAAYNCADRTMIIMTVAFLTANDKVIEAADVMQPAIAIPGTKAEEEFNFVCSRPIKPFKIDPDKLI